MSTLKYAWRIRTVLNTLSRYGLLHGLRKQKHVGFWPKVMLFSIKHPKHTQANYATRLREALEELGPIFVKFGQALSTRPDLIGPDMARELAKLQDRVTPFDGKVAQALIEKELGESCDTLFAGFDATPLASASIAQVHAATLHSGEQVVVKVLRPGVKKWVERDVGAMRALAVWAERFHKPSRRFKPIEVVDEYHKTVNDELDLMREAANAAQLKQNFLGQSTLKVPEVYWDFCRPSILTLERIFGVQINDFETLRAANTNLKVLAENGVKIFFTQVFEHNFFHADMHPGNVFVDITNPEKPVYQAVDFGIVGTLSPSDQHYLASNLLAFFHNDFHKVATLHVESGWVPETTSIPQFEAAIREVCEPLFNKSLQDISFGLVLVKLFQVAQRFDMQVQPQLVLLQKTLLNVEGLGRQLYPDLDLWTTAKPFLEQWMKARTHPLTWVKAFVKQWPKWQEVLRMGPEPILNALKNLVK